MKKNLQKNDLVSLRKKLIFAKSKYIYNRTVPKQTDFDKKKIEEIMFKKKSTLTVNFYDSLIFDEHKEFLKRYYSFEDIMIKIPQISTYINSISRLYPNYIDMDVGKYLFKNISCKQKLLDMNYKQEQEVMNPKIIDFEHLLNNSIIKEINLETARKRLNHDHRDTNEEDLYYKKVQEYDSMDSVENFLNFIDQTELYRYEQQNKEGKMNKVIDGKPNQVVNSYKIVIDFLDHNKNNEFSPVKTNETLMKVNGCTVQDKENSSSNKSLTKISLTKEKPITFFHYHNLNIKKDLDFKEKFSEKEITDKNKLTILYPEESKSNNENNKDIMNVEARSEVFYTSEIKLLLKKLEKKKCHPSLNMNKSNKKYKLLLDTFNLEEDFNRTRHDRHDKSDDFALFSNAKKQSSNISSTNKLKSFLKENDLTSSYISNLPMKVCKSIYSGSSNIYNSIGNYKNSISTRDEMSYLKSNTNHLLKPNANTHIKTIYQKISSNLFVEERMKSQRTYNSSSSNYSEMKKYNHIELFNKVKDNSKTVKKTSFRESNLKISREVESNQKISNSYSSNLAKLKKTTSKI